MLITAVGNSAFHGSEAGTAVWKSLSIWRRELTSTVVVVFSNLLATCHGPANTREPTCFPGSRPEGGRGGRVSVGTEGDVSGPGLGSPRKLQHHPPTEVILSSDLKVILPAEPKASSPRE